MRVSGAGGAQLEVGVGQSDRPVGANDMAADDAGLRGQARGGSRQEDRKSGGDLDHLEKRRKGPARVPGGTGGSKQFTRVSRFAAGFRYPG